MKLIDYIEKYYAGNKSAFARAEGKKPQRVSEMLHDYDYIVIDGRLWLGREKLKQDNNDE